MHMCLFGSAYSAIFNYDVVNGVAATRVTKMVLVIVSSTPGYFTYSNNSYIITYNYISVISYACCTAVLM